MTCSRIVEILCSVAGSYCTTSCGSLLSSVVSVLRGAELFISAEIEKLPSEERRVAVGCALCAGVLGADGVAGAVVAGCDAAEGVGVCAAEGAGAVAGALGVFETADPVADPVAAPTAEAAGVLAAVLTAEAVVAMFWDDACAGVIVSGRAGRVYSASMSNSKGSPLFFFLPRPAIFISPSSTNNL